MSTGEKRTWAEALEEAVTFRRMFDVLYYEWTIVGSVRRRKPEVSDIEHVVVPKRGEVVRPGSMFAEDADLVLTHLDELLAAGAVAKAFYPDGSHRWGDKLRGVEWRGWRHEVFIADADNFGSVLAIRTGPWQFSQRMVTQLRQRGWYHDKGRVRYLRGKCQGDPIGTPTEERFFELCGEPWTEPEDRR